ncbi:argininosuccinate lyase ArgH [Gottschalkia purinilytica]|uniref:Argininosuccinate lyase n=1 Tax=Gottschalkia purinilytica TaxID=1503 RepID=A0A0L0W9W6_GOTPU|nr:argininosuccinate lyase [Gottschalkia purinilytica]KNF08105.1 argininosuccinate lyase ArgH [Gottschalkia purinilytica]
MKLWGGRFQKEENKLMEDFNSSLPFDKRLYKQDITGSITHVTMLAKSQILTHEERDKIIEGLESILKDIEEGNLKIEGNYEDIHSFVESNLIQRIGELGKKLHTSRSRNDQVAVDMKLFAKENGNIIVSMLKELNQTISTIADENKAIMPGYTHLQRAQVVTFKQHMMAYCSMFERDKKRLLNCLDILDESPLGCCALAGTTYDIDRAFTAEKLGFKKPVDNFMDGVSDRDYLIEMLSAFSIIMMHLSRLSEELIIWSTQEFRFVQIDDAYATGSSIMPQKKNPDAAELIRGKTGRVYGALMGMLTTMKGIPLAYNKDMQEDKQQYFDALDTVTACLAIMNEMLKTIKVNKEVMKEAVKAGFLNATEVADYLVNKGVAFRDAHKIVGEIVLLCESKKLAIEDLTLSDLKTVDDRFENDIYDFIDYENVLNKGIKKELL